MASPAVLCCACQTKGKERTEFNKRAIASRWVNFEELVGKGKECPKGRFEGIGFSWTPSKRDISDFPLKIDHCETITLASSSPHEWNSTL
uniref:Uncharacterized protein n=1 Tax=Chromera velia CCMP2878 TaxID=1169474 RepID=A0A0G4IAW6_9ALVE|eukprot:Cvel_12677.t1-p1 / transcript=Cvel_12677.t1 / gene=Cvel_12677 / organism=Chromera_velia_CCMP2878 / gene_product=hypothetical protein / transcript_product=hypothetical protein / location=Cvel_scaffold838:40216-42250(+) / protein_length=89 / sequence_SO=supercontig / SO=protein_coding / is_pseudo=false